MENLAIPLLQASCSVSNQKTTFTTTEKEVIVHAPVSLIKQVIKLCDGTQTFEKVIETLSMAWDKESVEGFLEGLFSENIIVDGRKLEKNFWKAVSNPMLYPTIISPEMVSSLVSQAVERHRADDFDICFQHSNNQLGNLFARRRSVRSFSGEQVSFQSIVDLLWSAYGECSSKDGLSHRTIPSAGALYPLMFHICLFEKTDQLDAGVYRVCYGQDETVGFNHVSDDTLAFTRAFLNPADIQKGVHGVIVISGSFDISNQKYGNRSLLYVPLEAGHSAQNILLEATRQNVATLEIGGFVDKLLSDSIHLPTSYHPLTLVAFGKEQKKKTQKETPPSIEVDWAIPMANGYNPGFAIVSARLSPKRGWSHGRDPSPEMALKKAISETKEWTACGCVPELVQATYGDLDNVIDPQEVIRFYHYQYKTRNFPFEKFSDSIEYGWIKGVDVEGNQYHVLADHVYFPYFPDTPYYCYANSSGCAAHPDKKIALETATLELVERDSFMIAYLCQLDMPLVCHDTLPDSIKNRIKELEDVGFTISIVDHSLDLAPVVCVFAQNHEIHFTTCASCSSFDCLYAISHALSEVEASVLYRLQYGTPKAIKPQEVIWPNDHGCLYGQKNYYHKANFMFDSGRIISISEIGVDSTRNWHDLLKRFKNKGWKHIYIPLELSEEYGGNGDLYIVRAIVPGMVQMTFGYRQEPAGMPRIYEIAERYNGKSVRYGELTKFPHPFE